MFVSAEAARRKAASRSTSVIARLRAAARQEPGANLFLHPVQDLRVGGRQANAAYQFTLHGDDLDELRIWAPRLRRRDARAAASSPTSTPTRRTRGLQMSLMVDRDDRGAPRHHHARDRQHAQPRLRPVGSVSTIYQDRNQYRVIMEAAPEYTQGPATLDSIYVLSPTNGRRCRSRPSRATSRRSRRCR